jgi:hypothetical protein
VRRLIVIGSAVVLGGIAATVASSQPARVSRGGESVVPIPALAQTRIVAEYGHQWTFLPAQLPEGFRFRSWNVETGSFGYLLRRLQLHFRAGTSELLWEVASADADETEDRATCEVPRPPHVVNGRNVFSVGNGVAYICVSVPGKGRDLALAVSVRKRTPAPSVSLTQLEQMVGSAALPQPASLVPANRLVRKRDADALRASFGRTVPLPTTLPSGFVYTRWWISNRTTYEPRTAHVMFGRDGRRLQWVVAPSGFWRFSDCSRSGKPRGAQRQKKIGRRMVSLLQGAVGQSAWFCIGGSKPITVEMWNDYSVSGNTLMRLVASAR